MSEVLRLAVPNKGRLEGPTARLLSDAGLSYENAERALSVRVRNVALELLFVRTEDVGELVADGVAQLGITGLDLLAESGLPLEVVTLLGFGRCRLTAAVPNDSPVTDISGFTGLRVATAHPRITARYFGEAGIEMTLVPLRGSVEVAPKLDVADAIVDLVSSGSTMLVNGLRPVATLLESEAALVGGPGYPAGDGERVATMLQAVVAGRRQRYVLMNAPESALDDITAIIPGITAPSVVPLATRGMVAVHSVVAASDMWEVLPRLEKAGASGILVLPIEQMIP